MNTTSLTAAISAIKQDMHTAITTASHQGKTYRDGLEAKTALIRSERLIQRIHEITKVSLVNELNNRNLSHTIHPPLGENSPELNVWGLLKKKKQDIVAVMNYACPNPEVIIEGPMKGETDKLGKCSTKKAIVIGVRSQLSSIAKNFDTLMERAFAETLNMRLRHPMLIMGEVYMLAVKDYDEQMMKKNQVGWKNSYTNVERFISIFNGMKSERPNPNDVKEAYKYERSILLLVDFSLSPPKIYTTIDELKADGVVSPAFNEPYDQLSPLNFSRDLINTYVMRHQL
jgi:hypothetical protein